MFSGNRYDMWWFEESDIEFSEKDGVCCLIARRYDCEREEDVQKKRPDS